MKYFNEEKLFSAHQMVLVRAPHQGSHQGVLSAFEWDAIRFQWKIFKKYPKVMLGRHGLGWLDPSVQKKFSGVLKQEGDGRTPIGLFQFGKVFGLGLDKPEGCLLPYFPIEKDTLCVDDKNSKFYDTIVSREHAGTFASAEEMISQEVYRLGITLRLPEQACHERKASCIFFHLWKEDVSPTAGCVAMSFVSLLELVQWLDPMKHPILLISSEDALLYWSQKVNFPEALLFDCE